MFLVIYHSLIWHTCLYQLAAQQVL
uniref:Uncharacterized protein n=1 Tax=Anguilla anguilla TaxID=7936 RepID=A0A0E9PPM2_ANGAN